MKSSSLILLSVLCVLLGCSGVTNVSNPPATYLSVTGDWGLTATSTVVANSTFPVGVDLTSNQGSVSGIAHLSSSCYPIATNVPLTGTIDTSGNIALTSSSVNGQVLTVTGKTSTGADFTSGTYAVAGGCAAGDKGTVAGSEVPAVTGTYTGTVKSVSGPSVGVTALLTQTVTPDANGFLHLSGTAAFTGSPCFTQTTIATPATDTNILGLYLAANFTSSNPSAVIETVGSISADGKTLTISYQVVGGACAGDTGSGSLVL